MRNVLRRSLIRLDPPIRCPVRNVPGGLERNVPRMPMLIGAKIIKINQINQKQSNQFQSNQNPNQFQFEFNQDQAQVAQHEPSICEKNPPSICEETQSPVCE